MARIEIPRLVAISVLALLAAPAFALLDHDGTAWTHVINFDQAPDSPATFDADSTQIDGWTYNPAEFGYGVQNAADVWTFQDGIGFMTGIPGGSAWSWYGIPKAYGNPLGQLAAYTPEAGYTLEWRIKVGVQGNDSQQKIGIQFNTMKPQGGTGGEPYGFQVHYSDQPDPGATQPVQIVNTQVSKGKAFTTEAYETDTMGDFHTYRLVFDAVPLGTNPFSVNTTMYKDGVLLADDWGIPFAAGDATGRLDVGYISGSPGPFSAQWDFVRIHTGATPPPAGMACDFNSDSNCNDLDIDLLAAAVRNMTSDSKFNVDGLGDANIPDDNDFDFYITDDSMLSTGLGDHDLNMIVNFNDFVKLSNDFGNTGTGWDQGNGNTDDVTNFNDFVRVSNNFGMSFASGSNVPEPTALVLVAIGGLVAMRRWKA